jgi:putative phosphoribosyl transferase
LDRDVAIGSLPGVLGVPASAVGLVIFAHGSGSSRFSPRNRYAAELLQSAGLATLLFDLLTPAESEDRRNVFDIALLASRVEAAIAWAKAEPELATLPIGLFGASTGAGAALIAAVARPRDVAAVVSRGGRPDLAADALPRVGAPTLLIVGGDDRDVLALNEAARRRMTCKVELVVVSGASHLFEEPGALDQALDAARAWFVTHLSGASPRA